MRSMKRTMVRSIAPLAIIFSTALAARAVEIPKAPGETVREEFAKIQAAQNLDDVLHLVPDEHREMVSEMTPEEKEAALLQWKGASLPWKWSGIGSKAIGAPSWCEIETTTAV